MNADADVKNNFIAHQSDPQTNRDKVYIACIRKNDEGNWDFVGKWGRRGGHITVHIKSTHATPAEARAAAYKKFRQEISKGYIDVTSPTYNGPVTIDSVRSYLENDTDIEGEGKTVAANGKPAKKPARKKPVEEYVVQCNNNTGMTDIFDLEATYIAKTSEEEDMIQVLDVYGKWQTVRENRFERAEE